MFKCSFSCPLSFWGSQCLLDGPRVWPRGLPRYPLSCRPLYSCLPALCWSFFSSLCSSSTLRWRFSRFFGGCCCSLGVEADDFSVLLFSLAVLRCSAFTEAYFLASVNAAVVSSRQRQFKYSVSLSLRVASWIWCKILLRWESLCSLS